VLLEAYHRAAVIKQFPSNRHLPFEKLRKEVDVLRSGAGGAFVLERGSLTDTAKGLLLHLGLFISSSLASMHLSIWLRNLFSALFFAVPHLFHN
jgi:hypothetical protein